MFGCHLCHNIFTLTLQIIGRGNDQVAISSKFETREDIGESPVGLVGVGLGWVRGAAIPVPQPLWLTQTFFLPSAGSLRVRLPVGLCTTRYITEAQHIAQGPWDIRPWKKHSHFYRFLVL